MTFSAGVPTVWLGIAQYLADHPEADVSSIQGFLCGGSAVPRAMIDWYWRNRGIRVIQGWGMTETNPVASTATLKPEMEDWDFEQQLDRLETAGRPLPGLQVKIVDELGEELPQDGEAFGELLIRGPWVAAEYYRDPRSAQTFADGWMRTGDVCKITPDGYIKITDRAKDLIKSGGEWISSVELENALMAHPAVAEAAVVGLKHPDGRNDRWRSRCSTGAEASEDGADRLPRRAGGQVVAPRQGPARRADTEDGDRQVRQEGGAETSSPTCWRIRPIDPGARRGSSPGGNTLAAKRLMYEAVEFVEVWGRVGGTPAVARPASSVPSRPRLRRRKRRGVPGRTSEEAAAAISPGG